MTCDTPNKPTKRAGFGPNTKPNFPTDGAQESGEGGGVGSYERSRADETACGGTEADCQHRPLCQRDPDKNSAPGASPFVQEWHSSEEENGCRDVGAHFHEGWFAATHLEKDPRMVQSQSVSLLGEAGMAGELARPVPAGEPVGIIQQELDNDEPCTIVQQLTERLKSAWANVPRSTLERLASSMPNRVSKCATLRGEHIDM